MPDNLRNLLLTFPSIPVGGKEVPPDLRRLLFKGGVSIPPEQVDKAVREGLLGDVLPERVELVFNIHEYIDGSLAGGGSSATARVQIVYLSSFWSWAEKFDFTLSLSEVQRTYLEWAEHLKHRVRVAKDLKSGSAYGYVRIVGQILDSLLGRATPIIELTRVKTRKRAKSPQGVAVDKQSLHGTFAFGQLLQDICDGLPLEVIWEALPPVRISLQQGGEIKVSGGDSTSPKGDWGAKRLRTFAATTLAYQSNRSLDHVYRKNVVNLRIVAELLMFIGQTGMNLTQAQNLLLCRFNYSSDIDGYKVREYKGRRGGEVLFEIFSEYRYHFERYLAWRRELFPDSEKMLFPVIRVEGVRKTRRVSFFSMQAACKQAGVPWTPPRVLRGTRVNWLLRKTGDPDMTSDIAQNSKQVLLENYERPSLQRAVSEVTRFWQRNDPELSKKDEPLLPVAPGACDGNPKFSPAKPESATEPDCRRPSGCLWCLHHRDIDSFDYVWSVASFRHLKIIELSKRPPPTKNKQQKDIHPAEHAVKRLSEKLSWFRESNSARREWVEEALLRVEESDYHDQWSYLIEAMEGVPR